MSKQEIAEFIQMLSDEIVADLCNFFTLDEYGLFYAPFTITLNVSSRGCRFCCVEITDSNILVYNRINSTTNAFDVVANVNIHDRFMKYKIYQGIIYVYQKHMGTIQRKFADFVKQLQDNPMLSLE